MDAEQLGVELRKQIDRKERRESQLKLRLAVMKTINHEIIRVTKRIAGLLHPGETLYWNGVIWSRNGNEMLIKVLDAQALILHLSHGKADYWGPTGSYKLELDGPLPRPCPRCRERVSVTYDVTLEEENLTLQSRVCGVCASEIEKGQDFYALPQHIHDQRAEEAEVRAMP